MDNMHARMRVPEREAERPQPAAPAAEDTHRYVSPRPVADTRKKQKGAGRKKWWLVGIILVVALLGVGAWKVFAGGTGADGIDHSKYQALFLSNGTITNNVYFGKLERISDGYYRLTDVFYIKAAQASSDKSAAANSNDLTLAKLGDTEIYGPQDTVIIPREQVLYYQNMKDDSKIVQAITKYHSTNK